MSRFIHRLLLPLEFPEGISAGDGREGNHIIIARDGMGRFVLRGTSVAGALRHAYARQLGRSSASLTELFGAPFGSEGGGSQSSESSSRISVTDSVISTRNRDVVTRTHNSINRHTGVVIDGALVTLDSLPPGSTTTTSVWLESDEDDGSAREFLMFVVGLVNDGITLGGHSARGIGRARLSAKPTMLAFDRSTIDGWAAFADCAYAEREWMARNGVPHVDGVEIESPAGISKSLSITLTLGIPRGEDLLVGAGDIDFDHEFEPQQVVSVNDNRSWRIPGSSLRGVFRAWVTRLAARGGFAVADCIDRATEVTGDNLAWGFDTPATRKARQKRLNNDPSSITHEISCPVMRLFGSSYSKGRIHISDAYTSAEKMNHLQSRAHVAVDRFTGGANEGFFFTNSVITSTCGSFQFKIRMDDPTEQEVLWIAATIRALDLGIIAIGSSKAGGRLGLRSAPIARGPFAEIVTAINPSEASDV